MDHIWFTKTIYFDPELGYVMLKLPEISLPSFSYEDIKFEPKTELHCSLLSTKVLASEYFPGSPNKASEDLKAFIQEFVVAQQIVFTGFTERAYVCQEGDVMTIIIGAKLHGIEELFASLRAVFPELSALPDPLLHVTLYKYNHRYGIGIHNKAKLYELCRPIPLSDLPAVVKEIL